MFFNKHELDDLGPSKGVIFATAIGAVMWVILVAAILYWLEH